jgi:hypothetical protein
MDRVYKFAKVNWKSIVLIVLIFAILILVSTEGFTGDLADYPAIFMEKVAQPYVTDIKSVFNPQPYMPAINQLVIEAQVQSVMIDIGDGKAVEAPVQIPAQTVENIQEQKVIKYEEPKETDVVVAAQVVQLPQQEGVIKAPVNTDGDYIEVPVVVPAQTVVIPEQKAVETTMETFRL